jgi:NADP-dependent 3-hydroxy acid dehydrogenase YdfG
MSLINSIPIRNRNFTHFKNFIIAFLLNIKYKKTIPIPYFMKVVLITGASSGIGEATAEFLAKKDFIVVLVARNKKKLDAIVKKIKENKGEALAIKMDVCNEMHIADAVMELLDKYKRIDILINNAGIGYFESIENMKEKDWDEVFDVNVKGSFLVTKHVLPFMKKQDSGLIINISSMAAFNAFAGGACYCASKAALNGFSKVLKQEVREHKIKVATIMPGSVDTPFFGKLGMTVNKERCLDSEDVALACFNLITQPETLDVDEIILRPAYNPK